VDKMATRTGHKGQIVIEKPIRDALGIEPGSLAVQKLVDNHLGIYFYPAEHKQSLRGVLTTKICRRVSVDEWATIREAIWLEDWSDI
jgi:AbrB family looped-hinge helix DNA binding protein